MSSSPSSSSRVTCPVAPSLLLPSQYRKKNYSKQLPPELYLRTDLPCHTLLCDRHACAALATTHAPALAGASGGGGGHGASTGAAAAVGVLDPSSSDHYVVPSAWALQRFVTLFARAPQIHLILLHTHVKQAGAALGRQLRELLAEGASRRRAVLFENEAHAETATLQRRAERESNDERNERAIRRAARWYARHIRTGSKRIVLIEEGPGPTEEDVQREQEGGGPTGAAADAPTATATAAESAQPAQLYPRETGGITIHSMRSYLQWLQDKAPASSSSASSSASASAASPDRDPTPGALLDLYESLLESEKNKVRHKLRAQQADAELEAMLASCKIELKRVLSEGGGSGGNNGAPDAAPSLVHSMSTPAPSTLASGGLVARSLEQEYDEHLPLDVGLEAARRGLLYRGHIHVNKYHAQLDASLDLGGRMIDATTGAMVESAGGSSAQALSDGSAQRLGEIFIAGMADRNRAVDGDEVLVQLLPSNMWRAPTQRKKIAVKGATGAGAAADEEEEAGGGDGAAARPVPTGRVVCLVQRNRRPYVCTLQLDDGGGGSHDHALVVPMNECIPKIRIRTHQAAALASQRLLVQIDDWPADSKYPAGVYLQSLGRIGLVETGVRCILHELQISHPPFSINQMRCLPARSIDAQEARHPKYRVGSGYHSRGAPTPFSWEVPREALQGRLDLRVSHAGCVCSIDPVGCEDIDDALSVKPLPNGRVQIGVHIADVTYFVPQGSVLDQEAARRGTSVYLVDRRLDMLPGSLSSDLCSLRGGTDRLCLSVLWEIEPDSGRVHSTWYGRTVIHNAFALSYEEAQLIVDTAGGTRPLPPLQPSHPNFHLTLEERYDQAPQSSLTPAERRDLYPKILTLLQLGRHLRQERLGVGALELHSIDIKFKLDGDKQVVGVVEEADLEVHSTIAEWMVFANSTVAHAVWSRFPSAALLRHHPFPTAQRFERLIEMANNLDIPIDISSNKTLAASLHKAEEILAQRACRTASPATAKLLQAAAGGGSSGVSSSSTTPLDSEQSRSWMLKLLKELAARAMREAQYFSTGSVGHVRDFYHYGLAANFYTHFTSPIRRYADVIVHRQLLQVIEIERREFHEAKMEAKASKAAAAAPALASDAASSSGGGSLVSASLPSASHSGASSADLMSSRLLLSNDELTLLTRHLNAKNRNAKLAGAESQTLFLACYLAGEKRESAEEGEEGAGALGAAALSVPRSLGAAPLPPRVERCQALIVSLRSNGLIVLLPSYHVKGALMLVDRDNRALLAHPLALAFPPESSDAAGTAAASSSGPPARVDMDESSHRLTLSLLSPLPPPLLAPPALSPALPLSRSFGVFEPVVVDVSLRPNQSRYRTPKPVFTLVWQPEEKEAQRALPARPVNKANVSVAQPAAAAAPAPVDVPHAALSSGPLAPAGAKLQAKKKKSSDPSASLASSPLYLLLRDAATSNRHAKAIETQPRGHDDHDDHAHPREESGKRDDDAKRPAQRNANSRGPRLRYRITGALGGRVLHTPSGVIPPQLMAKRGLHQHNHEADEEEE